MSEKKMPIGKRFKKGEVNNPLGGKAHDPAKRALKRMTNQEFGDIATLVLQGNVAQLKAILSDENETITRKIIASGLLKSMVKGDVTVLDTILNRVAGRPKNEIDIGLSESIDKITFEIVNAKKD